MFKNQPLECSVICFWSFWHHLLWGALTFSFLIHFSWFLVCQMLKEEEFKFLFGHQKQQSTPPDLACLERLNVRSPTTLLSWHILYRNLLLSLMTRCHYFHSIDKFLYLLWWQISSSHCMGHKCSACIWRGWEVVKMWTPLGTFVREFYGQPQKWYHKKVPHVA